MDPSVSLRELRWGLEDLQRAITNDDYDQDELEVRLNSAKEHFEALDGWLLRGGAFPPEWGQRAPEPTPGEVY